MLNPTQKRYHTSKGKGEASARPTPARFSSVQSLSLVRLFVTPWFAACQASLSITNSRSSLRLMSIKSVMPSRHLILCRPLLLLPPVLPSIRVLPVSELFAWGGQSIGVSATASVLPMNTRDWSPLGWTGWISLQIVAYRALNDTGTSGYTFSTELPWINSLLGQSRFTRVRWKFPAYPFSGGGLTRVHDCGTRPCTHLTR